jgi:hypothetical protein
MFCVACAVLGSASLLTGLKWRQVTQAALLKRRTGQDEQRSTPESDGGAAAEIDDAGSM